MDLLKKSIKYYWALIVSSSISIIMAIMPKYTHLLINGNRNNKNIFPLRILMIIQLIHASYTAFNLKNILKILKNSFKKLFLNYLF